MSARTLEPLSTCPPEALAYHRGNCVTCHRPMASPRECAIRPELRRWFVGTAGRGTCGSCRGRERDKLTGPRPRADRQPTKEALPDREVSRLRAAVGACPGCGWTPDSGHHRKRACPVLDEQNDLELRETA